MTHYVLQLAGHGFMRRKTHKTFPETAYRELSARSAEPRRVLTAPRGPGESYSDIILRLLEA
jgi:hypothetical protein